jgi:hypothetical protein
VRVLLVVLAAVAVLVVMAVVRAAYDDEPTPAELRCQQLQVAAQSVPEQEDTVDDEVEYLRRVEAAEKACVDVD